MGKKALMFAMLAMGLLLAVMANAQEAAAAAGEFSMPSAVALLAGGLAIAVAAFAGALAQGRTASATMEGISRNPGAQSQMFVPWIVSMAFIESLVIYALVIAFMILSKVK